MDAAADMLTLAQLAGRPDIVLGPLKISPSTRVVRGDAGEAALEPRAMQVLVVLAEAEGRVVTRAELFRRCWGAAAVGDDSLNRAVADLRRAMRQAVGSDLSIETVPRTGYRIQTASDGIAPKPTSTRRLALAAGASGLVAAAAIGGWYAVRPGRDRVRAAGLVAQGEEARQTGNPEDYERAAGLLAEAAALDPGNADAWGKLALVRALLMDLTAPEEVADLAARVQESARRALALAPRQADALAARAILPPTYGDWSAAEKRLDSVIAVAPQHVPARDARSFLYASVGRTRANLAERLALSEREPRNATLLYRLVYAHWIMRRVEDADRAADRALQAWPRNGAVWFARLWTLAFTGRADRALALVEDVTGRPEMPPWMIDSLRISMTALHGRRPADVSRAADGLVDQVTRSPSASINALLILGGLGEVDRAFDIAEAYYLEEGPLMASVRWTPGQFGLADQHRRKTHTLFVPATAPMRSDPRFARLSERTGLSAYWRDRGVRPDV